MPASVTPPRRLPPWAVPALAFLAGAAATALAFTARIPAPVAAAGLSEAPAAGDAFLPHGFCFLWNRPLLWTHVLSDLVIGVSYVVIAATLVHFIRRARRDLPFSYVFLAFGLFIVACGATHFMEIWTF